MADTPFDLSWRTTPGERVELAPGLARVTAPNAGPMTFTGTNTYLVGDAELAVVDPGPDDDAHLAALEAAIAGRRVSAVVVTHAHVDHAPLSRRLAQMVDAPVMGFGDLDPARSPMMRRLDALADLGGGEGLDPAFAPDRILRDGDTVSGEGWQLTALHTPGHLADHLCLSLGNGVVLSGDHVMGWATTMVSPPHGDLTQFMASLRMMGERSDSVYYPGHGGPVTDPAGMIDWQIAHRQQREAQIREALSAGPATPEALARTIYTEVDPRLIPAATRNVLAHLLDLCGRDKVTCEGPISATARFAAI